MIAALAAAALSQAIVPSEHLPPSAEDPCALFDRQQTNTDARAGNFTIEDQVRMADIGRAEPRGASGAFDVSPDRRQIVYLVKRANPELNVYCQRVVVEPMNGSGPKTEIDRGGDFIRDDFPLRDFTAIVAGWDKPNPPHWSPDGTRVGFLKRVGGSTQVWLADPAGGEPARQATTLPDNVDRFAWSGDGKGLVVASRPGIRRKAEAIAREAPQGFLFGERFSPQFAKRPIPTGDVETVFSYVSLADGSARPATAEETVDLVPARPEGLPANARSTVAGTDGNAAWLEPKFPERLISPTRLVMRRPDGSRVACDDQACEGIRELWWSADGRAVLALQGTGWAKSQMALLRWDVGANQPRRILVTDDILFGCQMAGEELVCARGGAARPRRLVAIDARTGAERTIVDPNPAFRNARFGIVQRLRFRNAFGAESYADLVLPTNHRPGQKHPLVVVQYTSDGFLRGGTGDEVPIHPLANRGFAVLSFSRPYFSAETTTARTDDELVRANRANWIDRRRVQSSLEEAVRLAIQTGAIDADRMGISGFSDGASTVQWALINSDLFKVASLGSCCEDLYTYPLEAGPRFAALLRTKGYRHFEIGSDETWKPLSLILNADRIDVPLLIQTGDSEYEAGLDVVATYKLLHKAIELYVLEDETHVKWQPAHRQAIYTRATEWFEFWLMHRIDCDPSKAEQYRRWKAMAGAPAADLLHCSTSVTGSMTAPNSRPRQDRAADR